MEHVIGHDAINIWNSSQKKIEDCFQSIRQSQRQIEEMQSLIKWLEKRKKKLAEEGLFLTERKKPLPFLPDLIGIITSPSGAVIKDILHV